MKMKLFSLVGLLAIGSTAMAQHPNSAQNHALRNSNSPNYMGSSQQPVEPPMRWATRWGAIAADGQGTYGIVSDMPSKRAAKKAAIQECRNRGGGACALEFTYHNQCAAVGAGPGRSYSYHAPSIDEAEASALEICESRGEGACRVYYSGCSMPVRVQ